MQLDIFTQDPLEGGRAVVDYVEELYPIINPPSTIKQKKGESLSDYQERRDADMEFGKLVSTARLANNSQAAMLLRIKAFIQDGYISVASAIRDTGAATPAEMIQVMYEAAGLDFSIDTYKWSQLNSYITRVIPALIQQGVDVKDDWLLAIFDTTGRVQIPKVVRNAIQMLARNKKLSKDEAKTVAAALDGNYEARQELDKAVSSSEDKLPATEEILPDGAGRIIIPYTSEEEATRIKAVLKKICDVKPY